jgi:hypothetical protein
LRGNFGFGFTEYEFKLLPIRWVPGVLENTTVAWNKGISKVKNIPHPYQSKGFGDGIQFSRYIRQAMKEGSVNVCPQTQLGQGCSKPIH